MPIDPTPEEISILKFMAKEIYKQFIDPKDKLIIALFFDLGYSALDVSEMIGISTVAIFHRRNKIKRQLSSTYKTKFKTVNKAAANLK